LHQTEIRPASLRDSELLGPLLIPEDVENAAQVGMDGKTALFESIKASEKSLVVLVDDVIASMMGVTRRPMGSLFWIATGKAVNRAPLAYFRTASHAFERICEGERSLVSIVGVEHKRALRLAKMFGFKVSVPLATAGGQTVCLLRWERA
jgi:hypothetical protein